METRDPDDILTLCLLATHPATRLVAVTANPGTPAQIGVIRTVLDRLGIDVPVGARIVDKAGDVVSPFHRMWLGDTPAAKAENVAHELLAQVLTDNPDTILLTAAPVHNLRLLLNNHPGLLLNRWVAQGGFAGDNLVPPGDRLPKFAGLTTCESFNFGHDVKGACAALSSDRIQERRLVSKNVTHGVVWDQALQDRLAPRTSENAGLAMAWEAMAVYFRDRPEGKMLHDPMAAAAAIEPEAFRWAEVEVYRDQGRWGARAQGGTRTFITVSADARRALSVLLTPADTM
jgi:inosine-uridine nucleoside N-ribohydrolase